MDNKITKTRLSNFLSYEWILMLIISIVVIVALELAYTIGAVRLTTGQDFKYYYDQSISGLTDGDFYNFIKSKNTLSYDVLEFSGEVLTGDYNVLSVRLSIQEGDILITDRKQPDKEATDKSIRARSNIDNFEIYDLEKMLKDARSYLKDNFLKDGVTVDGAELDYQNLDQTKIENYFLERMKGDNRFRSDGQKAEGIILEKQRIEKLCKDVADYKYFMENAPSEAFYRYTKYEQTWQNTTPGSDMEKRYKEFYDYEIEHGRENAIYGINLEYLTGGNTDISAYFRMADSDTAKDVVLMAFDFYKYQPHLQFETVSFFMTIIRECSNIIPA